jgi:hypothetical protein
VDGDDAASLGLVAAKTGAAIVAAATAESFAKVRRVRFCMINSSGLRKERGVAARQARGTVNDFALTVTPKRE